MTATQEEASVAERMASESLPRSKSLPWSMAVLVGAGLLALVRVLYAPHVELAPQEAYYWQYARHPALSYFDHPPMSAWMIGLSTRWMGDTELAVRVPTILSGFALTWLLYGLGRRLYSARAGALAALAANATVLLGLGGVVMTPDVPLVLCWTAALRVLCELVLPDGAGAGRWGARWYLLGTLVGLGMLSKYTAGLLLPQVLATALLTQRGREALRTPYPYVGVLVALCVFSPVLVWNATHGWASFAFQTAGRASEVRGVRPFLVGRYVGLQAVAVGPVLYVGLWLAAWRLLPRARAGEPRAVLLALSAVPGLLLFTAVSPVHWVKMNWVAPCYLGLMVALAGEWSAGWDTPRVRRWAWGAVGSGAVLTGAMYLMPLVPWIPFSNRDALTNGWKELAERVEWQRTRLYALHGAAPEVVGWGYKAASELAFYLPGRPRTQSSGVLGGRGLAYDYWLDAEMGRALSGRDVLVVEDRREKMRDRALRLSVFCETHEQLEEVAVHRGSHEVTRFTLWYCHGLRPQSYPFAS